MRSKKKKLCVLQGMDNTLLGSGFLVQMTEDSIEIENANGLPTLPLDMQIKVTVHGLESGLHISAGRVYYSSSERLRVDDLVLCTGSEQRKTYRVTINSPGTLLVYALRPGEGGYGDKLFEEPVTVRDISTGGCLLVVDKNVRIAGCGLKLRLTMYETIEEFDLEIMTARDKSISENLYGMAFRNVNQRMEQVLDLYLLRVQQEQIRRSRGVGY